MADILMISDSDDDDLILKNKTPSLNESIEISDSDSSSDDSDIVVTKPNNRKKNEKQKKNDKQKRTEKQRQNEQQKEKEKQKKTPENSESDDTSQPPSAQPPESEKEPEKVAEILKAQNPSSGSSDEDSPPLVKKKRATRRFRVPKPTSESNEDVASTKAHIYSNRVTDCFSTLHYGAATEKVKEPLVDLSEEEDEVDPDAVFGTKKKGRSCCRKTKKQDKSRTERAKALDLTDGDSSCMEEKSTTPKKSIAVPTYSPSPPPPPTFFPNVRPKRQSKSVKTALKNLDRAKYHLCGTTMSGDDSFNFATPEKEHEVIVKVRSRSGLHRFPMQPRDTFISIVKEMSKREMVPESSNGVLFLGENTIEPFMTVSSSGVTVADILYFSAQDKDQVVVPVTEIEDEDDEVICIRVQCDNKKQSITVGMKKTEVMLKIFEHFAKVRNYDVKKIRFEFDGEVLKGTETPLDLDMENEDCIDAIVL